MTTRRTAKIASALQESVSSAILMGMKDPRVKNVTVTRVEVSSDFKSAKVFVSVMGDKKAQSLCMHGLKSARGFLQAKVADRLQTRYTPILKFVLDPSIKMSFNTSKTIEQAMSETDSINNEESPETE